MASNRVTFLAGKIFPFFWCTHAVDKMWIFFRVRSLCPWWWQILRARSPSMQKWHGLGCPREGTRPERLWTHNGRNDAGVDTLKKRLGLYRWTFKRSLQKWHGSGFEGSESAELFHCFKRFWQKGHGPERPWEKRHDLQDYIEQESKGVLGNSLNRQPALAGLGSPHIFICDKTTFVWWNNLLITNCNLVISDFTFHAIFWNRISYYNLATI